MIGFLVWMWIAIFFGFWSFHIIASTVQRIMQKTEMWWKYLLSWVLVFPVTFVFLVALTGMWMRASGLILDLGNRLW